MNHPLHDLDTLADVLWPGAELRLPGTTATTSARAVHERYLAMPSVTRPRYLLPDSLSPSATARLLREYNSLRATGPRLARAMVAGAASTGWLPRRRRQRVQVCLNPVDGSLLDLAAAHLGRHADDLVMACGVRVEYGVARPIVTVADRAGRPVLFVKVASTPLHRRRLTREHSMLVLRHREPVPGVHTPAPRFLQQWRGRLVLATEPLPAEVAPLRVGDTALPTRVLETVAGAARTSYTPEESPWTATLRERADHLSADNRALVLGAIDQVVSRHQGVLLQHASGHGDWSCWNMGRLPGTGELALWDWEFGHEEAPVGLDRLHWSFAAATTLRGTPVHLAVAEQRHALRDAGPGPAAVSALHTLEMITRRLEEASSGNLRSEGEATHLLATLG